MPKNVLQARNRRAIAASHVAAARVLALDTVKVIRTVTNAVVLVAREVNRVEQRVDSRLLARRTERRRTPAHHRVISLEHHVAATVVAVENEISSVVSVLVRRVAAAVADRVMAAAIAKVGKNLARKIIANSLGKGGNAGTGEG